MKIVADVVTRSIVETARRLTGHGKISAILIIPTPDVQVGDEFCVAVEEDKIVYRRRE